MGRRSRTELKLLRRSRPQVTVWEARSAMCGDQINRNGYE
jgi:hypothetical protein